MVRPGISFGAFRFETVGHPKARRQNLHRPTMPRAERGLGLAAFAPAAFSLRGRSAVPAAKQSPVPRESLRQMVFVSGL